MEAAVAARHVAVCSGAETGRGKRVALTFRAQRKLRIFTRRIE